MMITKLSILIYRYTENHLFIIKFSLKVIWKNHQQSIAIKNQECSHNVWNKHFVSTFNIRKVEHESQRIFACKCYAKNAGEIYLNCLRSKEML